MNRWGVVWNQRTKILGLLHMLVGAVVANLSALQANLDPKSFGLIMFGTGVLNIALGYYNDYKQRNDQ